MFRYDFCNNGFLRVGIANEQRRVRFRAFAAYHYFACHDVVFEKFAFQKFHVVGSKIDLLGARGRKRIENERNSGKLL